ncbi:conserved hypothetical protein [Ricinus communis]|uniref:Uncharacterized protein n=1 Tax=Ricinus communis TaxID=3988 RepID=B9TKJ7_RICCO|nr:conserved hypothetical protein [Ricinus communis]
MIPRFAEADAGRVAMHEPCADARRRLIRAGPYGEPRQPRAACRVELAAVQYPVIAFLFADGARQSAARRRTQFRLDAQRIDERAALDSVARNAFLECDRPVGIRLQTQMVEALHHDDQRCRRLAARNGTYHLQRLREGRFAAAERARHRQREQPGAAQLREVVVWKMRPRVERGGAGGEIIGQRGEPRIGARTVEVRERVEGIGVALVIDECSVGMAACHIGPGVSVELNNARREITAHPAETDGRNSARHPAAF